MTPDNDLALRLSAIHQERLRLDDDEADVVRDALAQAHGLVSRAAQLLGLSRHTLWRLVRPGGRLSHLEAEAAEARAASGYVTGRPPAV
jgi:DNA-binding NtrC family response regulator